MVFCGLAFSSEGGGTAGLAGDCGTAFLVVAALLSLSVAGALSLPVDALRFSRTLGEAAGLATPLEPLSGLLCITGRLGAVGRAGELLGWLDMSDRGSRICTAMLYSVPSVDWHIK